MVLLVLAAYAILGFAEVPRMVHDQTWKELIVFGVLFVMGFVVFVLICYNIHVPSPIRGIRYLLTEVLHADWVSIRESLSQ